MTLVPETHGPRHPGCFSYPLFFPPFIPHLPFLHSPEVFLTRGPTVGEALRPLEPPMRCQVPQEAAGPFLTHAPLSAAAHKHKKQDLLHPCDTEYPVFVHQTAVQETNGIIECGACQK